jgi:hypothetical protein
MYARTEYELARTLRQVRSIIPIRSLQAKWESQDAEIPARLSCFCTPQCPVRLWGPSKGYSKAVFPEPFARVVSDINEKTGAVNGWKFAEIFLFYRSLIPPSTLFTMQSKNVVKVHSFLNDTHARARTHTPHTHTTHTHTHDTHTQTHTPHTHTTHTNTRARARTTHTHTPHTHTHTHTDTHRHTHTHTQTHTHTHKHTHTHTQYTLTNK